MTISPDFEDEDDEDFDAVNEAREVKEALRSVSKAKSPSQNVLPGRSCSPLRTPLRLCLPGDPVRMYLKEIGKVDLLTASEEVHLLRRLEAGTAALVKLEDLRMASIELNRAEQRRLCVLSLWWT